MRTALAEAELEYPEKHVSRSIYVGFRVTELAPKLKDAAEEGKEARVAQTTPNPKKKKNSTYP